MGGVHLDGAILMATVYPGHRWRSPVRADGVKDGNWWYYEPDEPRPDDAEPVTDDLRHDSAS